MSKLSDADELEARGLEPARRYAEAKDAQDYEVYRQMLDDLIEAGVLQPVEQAQEGHSGGRRIAGVGPDQPRVWNEKGGGQSRTPYRFDLVDAETMFILARVLGEGAEKYGDWNWRDIPIQAHLNHALQHIYAYMADDVQDDHLGHALTRLMFALSLDITPEFVARMTPTRNEEQAGE